VRTRVAAPTLAGGLLVVLVAIATVGVAWLLWTRADDRERVQDERAAQSANEAIQNSIGRVLTSLRASAGLVDTRGNVDTASFEAFARAVGSIGVSDVLALAEIVPAAERQRFEAAAGRRIVEQTGAGTLRAAGNRPLYVPVVAVWPSTGEQTAVLGFDLMSDPERRATLARAEATRSTVFTPAIDFVLAGRGYAALRPIYAPTGSSDAPVAFVTTRFSMRRIASVLRTLPPDLRVRVTIDGSEVYSTEDPPRGGVTRSLGLGGRRWLLTASGEPAGHSSSLAILLGGAIFMLMLGAFTWTRASSERRLRSANEAERGARERAEGLERNAARLQARADLLQRLAAALSAAALPNEVAEAAVPFLFEAFGADLCTVGIAWGDDVRTLKVPASAPAERHWRPVPRATSTPTADALRGRQVMELHGHDEIARRYPPEVEQLLEGIVSIVVVPLPRQAGAVGVAFAESRTLDASDRGLLDAIAEELTQALDRAALLERERDARLDAELLEQNATRLAAAATVTDVAESTVADFEAFGADVVFVWRLIGPERLEGLASSDVPASTRTRFEEYPLELGGLVSDVMAEGRVIAVDAESYDALYPAIAAERQRVGLESLVALPLRAASGEVIGAIFAASRRQRWASDDRRPLLVGMAEQAGVALERATLFEAEREARRLAELLERNAAQLAAAVTVHHVARATVADLRDAGFGPAAVHTCTDDGGLEILAVAGVPEDLLGDAVDALGAERSPAAETLRTGGVVEVVADAELDERYPDFAAVRERTGVQAVVAVPLRAASREVLGVLTVGFVERPWSGSARRDVVLGVAEQCGLAVERARLYADAVKAADASAFLVRLGESLEWATSVHARARRLVEVLTEEHATFAGVHLLDEDGAPNAVVSTGSRPSELADDSLWAELVEGAIAAGREVRPERDGALQASTPLILPLRARGHTLGALTIRSAAGEDWAPLIGDELAREIASRAAVILDNAVLYEHEREVSHTLQLGLLGGGPPPFEHITVSAAYRAGTAALEVGGDWYDAFTLPSGAVALVVGDVVGHGLEAAVAMGQLRGAVSALAQTTGPSRLLERLDVFVETVPSAATATLAYVELDPVDGVIRYACAGHPPPLVVSTDGRTRFLWEGRSPPLGSMLGERRAAADRLEEGETLVLYTDGLVERRSESIDAGLERLADAALLASGSPATYADDICDAVLGRAEQDDDVCVLTTLRLPTRPLFNHSLRAAPAELAALRDNLRAWLVDQNLHEDIERSTVLAVSEAAANAIEHGYDCDGEGVVTVTVALEDGWVDVEVRDQGTWRDGPGEGDRGRGLAIMRSIMDRLSVERDDGATVVRMGQPVERQASV
jgi:serine/threonine-protein kinase RsbW